MVTLQYDYMRRLTISKIGQKNLVDLTRSKTKHKSTKNTGFYVPFPSSETKSFVEIPIMSLHVYFVIILRILYVPLC